MNAPTQFDDIRPLNQHEVPQAIEQLTATPEFQFVVHQLMPDADWDSFAEKMRSCKSKEEFKTIFSYLAARVIAKTTTKSLTIGGVEKVKKDDASAHTFISNHRDIVLDATFLNVLLHDEKYGMTQVAIGDNLLIRPWIHTLVRLNNSFIVKRGLSMRQQLEASRNLSQYIHYTIKETKESLWIAQREGRAKDSNDRTQESLMKMLNMGGDSKQIIENIKSLNIAPVTLSYEYDPCDYLKAKEFQQKRDDSEYVKSPQDDLLNMQTGITQTKGHVHFQVGTPLNEQLTEADCSLGKGEIYGRIASLIDSEIFKNYRFYPCNYIAYDALYETSEFASKYTAEEKQEFNNYLKQQLAKIDLPNKDEAFLTQKMLEMYSNPLKNSIHNL